MSPLTRLVYVSEIADATTDVDVQVLLGAAQIRNRRLDVTGMLVRGGCHFLQVLEGRAGALDDVMGRIAADSRHRGVRILARESVTRRQFGDWAMGLVRRGDVDDDLAELHRTGRLGELDLRCIVERLMPVAVA